MSDKKRAPKKVAIDYKNGKIYKLVNDVNDMIYIGSTTQTLSRRFSCHKSKSKTETTNIYSAMHEIGVDHFQIILIELFSCTCKAELEAREYAVMYNFTQNKLYNSVRDGKHNAETKQKMRENGSEKGKFGPDHNVFKRGCINHYQRADGQQGFRFKWQDNGKGMIKKFTYGIARSSEMAYMLCVEYRNQIYPLTNEDQHQELPVAE